MFSADSAGLLLTRLTTRSSTDFLNEESMSCMVKDDSRNRSGDLPTEMHRELSQTTSRVFRAAADSVHEHNAYVAIRRATMY